MPQQIDRLRILCVSSGRSDLFIWLPVFRVLAANDNFEVIVLKTGMHQKDGSQNFNEFLSQFTIMDAGEDLGGYSTVDAGIAMGKSVSSITKVLNKVAPDFLFVLGDRLDMLPAVVAALPFNIRIIHLHGGEVSQGAIDDRIRHAVSMMSQVHFVAHDLAKKKLLSFGINENQIFVVGAPGLDNLLTVPDIALKNLAEQLGLPIKKDFFLGTIHSETNSDDPVAPLVEMIEAIERMPDQVFVFTHSNSDPCNIVINDHLRAASQKLSNLYFVQNLEYEKYVQLMHHANAVIGNSSSGIIEAPFLGKIALNVGDRQKGRAHATNVLHCTNNSEEIVLNLNKILKGKEVENLSRSILYGDGNAAQKIGDILGSLN